MTSRNCFRVLFSCVLFLLTGSLWAADLGRPQPFSGDYTTTTTNGQKITGKFYFSYPKMRIDLTGSQMSKNPLGGGTNVIIDSSTQTVYVLMPQMKMYMEVHGDSGRSNPGMRNLQNLGRGVCPEDATCKKVGSETVNGRDCDKYEATDKNGKVKMLWVDQKLNFPVKIQGGEGTLTEFTNIKEGAPDPSFFNLPPGYRAFDPSGHGQPNN